MHQLDNITLNTAVEALELAHGFDDLLYKPYDAPEQARRDHGLLSCMVPRRIIELLNGTHTLKVLHPTQLYATQNAIALGRAAGVTVGPPRSVEQLFLQLQHQIA